MTIIVKAAPVSPFYVPKAIVNGYSVANFAYTQIGANSGGTILPQVKDIHVTLGAASTLVTALSLTGPGQIAMLHFCGVDTTARNLRAVLTLDGTVVFDYTSSLLSNAGSGGSIIGNVMQSVYAASLEYEQVTFLKTCLLQISSTVANDTGVHVGAAYKL